MSETQINVGMNVDGVITGTEKAKRKLSELGGAAREAGKGTGAIGDGMAGSAAKVESATKNMVGSIQRQIAALEAGDKASRAYQESLARMRGIDVAALKPYLDQLDAAKLKQAEAAKSAESLAGSMGAIKIAAVAIGASVGALAVFSKSIIDAADGLNDLSQSVGISVRELGKYKLAAEQSGSSLEAIAKGVKGLAGNMLEHGAALRKAGVDATSADGAMQQLADVFKEMPDGIEKTTLATKLFGKAGMDLIPMLNLGSDGLRDAAVASADFAEQMAIMAPLADSLNDKMAEMALSSKTAGAIMVNEFLPSLNQIAAGMVSAKDSANSFATLMGSVVNVVVQTSAVLISDVAFVLRGVGIEVGGIAAQIGRLAVLDFKGFTAIGDAMKEDAARARKELDQWQYDLVNGVKKANSAAQNEYNKRQGFGYTSSSRGSSLLGALGGDSEAKKAASELNKELEKQAGLLLELSGYSKSYTEDAQRLVAMRKEGALTEAAYGRAITELVAKQPGQIKLAKEQAEAQKEIEKAIEATAKQWADYKDQQRKSIVSSSEEVSKAQEAFDAHGKLASVIQQEALARLENARAQIIGTEDTAVLDAQIAAKRKLVDILKNGEVRKANEDAATAAKEAWAKTSDSIRDSLTDAFMGAIDGTKSAWVSLRDWVTGLFKSMVLRPIVQGVMAPIAGAVTSSMFGTAANAATGASTFGSVGSLLGSSSMGALDIAGFGVDPTTVAIGAALLVLSQMGGKFVSSSDSGRAAIRYSATGIGGSAYNTTGDALQSAAAQKSVETLAKSYFQAAAKLGLKAMEATFEIGSNTGREGAASQTVLGVNIGKLAYSSGEIASGDTAALQLAASRAILTALQASDMPGYLAKVFDGITAGSASQDQINAAMGYAESLKTVRDALLETREPLQIVQDSATAAMAALSTTAATFKTDFVAAIDSGVSPDQLAQWQALGTALDQVKAAADEAAKATESWQNKLDIATGKTTQREIDKATALAIADDATDKLITQLYAVEDAAQAAQELKTMNAAIADMTTSIRDFYDMVADKSAALKTQQQSWADTYTPPDLSELANRIADSINGSGATENISATELLAKTSAELKTWAAEVSQLTVPETVVSDILNADALRGAISSAVAGLFVADSAKFEAALKDDSIGTLLAGSITTALKALGIDDATATSSGTYAGNSLAAVRVAAASDWTPGMTTQQQAADWVKDALGNLDDIALTATIEKSIFTPIEEWVNSLISQVTTKENYVAPTEPAKTVDTSITDGLTKEGKTLAIALLEAQGKMTEAKAAAKALATEGMDALQIAMWDTNEATRKQIEILTEQKTLQDELNTLRDTEAQAMTRQRDALDSSNRALFDQVQGFKSFNALSGQFAPTQTAAQASAAVSGAGYNVAGLGTEGIKSYITGILNAPGMIDANGDLTTAGLSTVATLQTLSSALTLLGTEGDKAAEKLKATADATSASYYSLHDQLNVLSGNWTQTEVDRANVIEELTKTTDGSTIALQKMVWGMQDWNAAVATQGTIFDKLATDPQKKASAQTSINDAFAGLGIAVPTTVAAFLELSESANTQTIQGQQLVSVLGTVVDDFALLHVATKDITQDYQRALLEASGNTSGLEAFDKAISDAALITAGWTQAQIDAVDATRQATKIAAATQDYNRAMIEATGNSSGLKAFDDAITDTARLAAGWTEAQVKAVRTTESVAEAMAKLKDQIDQVSAARESIASGRQAIVSSTSTFDAPAYWSSQQAILGAQLSSTGDTTLKIKYASALQTAIDSGLQAQITALDKVRDTRIKALTEEAQLADDNAVKAKQAAQEMYSAFDGIAKYARGLSTTDLSPLDPKAKLDAAASEYQRLLGLTQGGDSSAAGQLTGASDTYLTLAKDYYASTAQYSAIFGSVESTLTSLGAQVSVYEKIANSVAATYDLQTATAAVETQYQADLLALQSTAIGKYDALDATMLGFQTSLEVRSDAQYVEIQNLNTSTENVASRVTQSGAQVSSAVSQNTAATQQNAALLQIVIALLQQLNSTSAATATATQTTASASTLATAL